MRLHISSWRAVQEKLTLQWVPEGCDLVAPAEAVVSLEEFIKDQGAGQSEKDKTVVPTGI